MKTIVTILMILLSSGLFSQPLGTQEKVQISVGYSKTGSGDLPGVTFGAEYVKYFKAKMSWSAGFAGFIYDGEDLITNQRSDAGLRYVTAGVQLMGHLGLALIKTSTNELQFQPGVLVKYQTESVDGYAIHYPPIINYPEPVVTFYNPNPQRTISAGISLQLTYNYTLKSKFNIGILAGGQTDTNADLIYRLSLTMGKWF